MRALHFVASTLLLVPSIAAAHIHLTNPLSRTDLGTGDQKDQHCGVIGYTRDPARVTTYKPGQTITVTWQETIQHPGWFRISFQPNGDVFRIPPPDPAVTNNYPSENLTGMLDPGGSGSTIMVDRIADGTLQMDITFPNIECDNCTLQFIQVMTDKPLYTADAASDDIYFNCADITLTANAPDAGTSGSPDAGDMGSNNNNGGPTLSGGCSAGGGTGGLPVALALFGFVGLRRRRR